MEKRLKNYKYKNLTFLAMSLFVAYILLQDETFHSYLLHLGSFGYLGALISGALFVSTFTVAIATVMLLVLAENLSPVEIALIAGIGAVIGDLLIFHLVKDNLVQEITSLYDHVDGDHHLQKVFRSRYFSWTLPVVGALLIASPLPDEMGVSLMGISRMRAKNFLLLSFVLNSIGIFLVIMASTVIKP
jgi:uncharacterized membrane protein YdjX (TVP38/TMEM64 family)